MITIYRHYMTTKKMIIGFDWRIHLRTSSITFIICFLRSPAGIPPSRKAASWASVVLQIVWLRLNGLTDVVLVNDSKNQIFLGKENCGKTVRKPMLFSKAGQVPISALQRVLPLGDLVLYTIHTIYCNKVVPPVLGDGTIPPKPSPPWLAAHFR